MIRAPLPRWVMICCAVFACIEISEQSVWAGEVLERIRRADSLPIAGCWSGDKKCVAGSVTMRVSEFQLMNSNTSTPDRVVFRYGNDRTFPIVGDWDANGTDTVGVVFLDNMEFHLRNSNTGGPADITFRYGSGNSFPIVGDWDGNGTDTIGVVFLDNMEFHLRNSNTGGPADIKFRYGNSNAFPIVGDWDGNGTDTIGVVFMRSMEYHLRNSNTGGPADIQPFRSIPGNPNYSDGPGRISELKGAIDQKHLFLKSAINEENNIDRILNAALSGPEIKKVKLFDRHEFNIKPAQISRKGNEVTAIGQISHHGGVRPDGQVYYTIEKKEGKVVDISIRIETFAGKLRETLSPLISAAVAAGTGLYIPPEIIEEGLEVRDRILGELIDGKWESDARIIIALIAEKVR